MFSHHEYHGLKVVTLHSQDGCCSASFVAERGGVCSSLKLPGLAGEARELLFHHPHLWDRTSTETPGGWPFLFPNCGRLERDGTKGVYLLEGRRHNLPLHGFAMHQPWELTEIEPLDRLVSHARLRLRLSSSPSTLEAFPFAFTLELDYHFEGNAFICRFTCCNLDERPLPLYAGFHPYFLTPPPGAGKEDTWVDFRPLERWVYNERLTDVVGVVAPPIFPRRITDPNINELLCRLGPDKEARLLLPDGLTVHMKTSSLEESDLYSYLQLYTLSDKPFVCLEPWMAPPNSFNSLGMVKWIPPQGCQESQIEVWTSRRERETLPPERPARREG